MPKHSESLTSVLSSLPPPNYFTTNSAHHDHCHQLTNFLPFPAPHLNSFDLVNYSLSQSQSQSQSPAPPLLPTLFYTLSSILFRGLPNPSPYEIHNLYYLFPPLPISSQPISVSAKGLASWHIDIVWDSSIRN